MNRFFILFLLFISIVGCSSEDNEEFEQTSFPEEDPINYELIGRDTIFEGSHLGININKRPADIYSILQKIKDTLDITLTVTSNSYKNIIELEDKIELYKYILIDDSIGSSNGLQLSYENDKLKSIFNNNGDKFSKWPKDYPSTNSLFVGEDISLIYSKLLYFSKDLELPNIFQSVRLRHKNLLKPYDSGMSNSPQWYFAYLPKENSLEVVQINIENDIVSYIALESYELPDL